MTCRLSYAVDADGSARLELECDGDATPDQGGLFLAALDRLPKAGVVDSGGWTTK